MEQKPASEEEPLGPGKRTRSGWAGQVGTAAACLSALIAVYAAYSSVAQVNIAKRQNEIADRQSLAALVTDIAQQTRALTNASAQQNPAIGQARQADAEEALTLVRALKSRIPAIDNYEIATAFEGADEDFNAMTFYERAARVGSSPHYRASSLRGEAQILYALGGPVNDRRARADIVLAYHAYDGQPDVSRTQLDQNEAFTVLFSVEHVASFDCPQARTELQGARHLIEVDPAAVNAGVRVKQEGAQHAIEQCR